jgi:multidrug resistance efflux pump
MKPKTGLLSALLLLLIVSVSYATPPDQPYMQAARAELQRAKAELQVAEHNKGGHRANAVAYINSAIAEVNRGIVFDRRHNHAQRVNVLIPRLLVPAPDQPHMRSALSHLLDARKNLESATSDKGGHRVKAIDYVNSAIDEVNKGIAAGA